MTEQRHEDRRVQLSIKIGSLADEARRIRKRELLARRDARINSAGRKLLRPFTIAEGLSVRRLLAVDASQEKGIGEEAATKTIHEIQRKARDGRRRIYNSNRPKGRDRNLRLARDLALHRRGVVRSEARHSQLALAFIRGRAYRSVESSVRHAGSPDGCRVTDLVLRFGGILGPQRSKPEQRQIQVVHEQVRDWIYRPRVTEGPLCYAEESTGPRQMENAVDPIYPAV